MAQKTIRGNEALAKQIKNRRNELGLTIEEAAARAGVGTKTWCKNVLIRLAVKARGSEV